MAQCELAYMTWKEVEAARDRGAAVLVPIGTHEQNGTLGPMGTDGLLVFEITKRIAAETGAVVAPLLAASLNDVARAWFAAFVGADRARVAC